MLIQRICQAGIFHALITFALFSVFNTPLYAEQITFSWQANPAEDQVSGYRMYYGPESRFTTLPDSAYSRFIDFSEYAGDVVGLDCPVGALNWRQCNILTDTVSCDQPLWPENPSCTVDLPVNSYAALTAYNAEGTESAFSSEVTTRSELVVTNISGDTTEYGGRSVFLVWLTRPALGEVTISLHSSDETEGTISVNEITLSAANYWFEFVIVSGQNDDIVDGDIPYAIAFDPATSTDPRYDGVQLPSVDVVNMDNDTDNPEIVIFSITDETSEDGAYALYLAQLIGNPTADVTVALSSDDTTEGTVFPESLTFTGEDGGWQFFLAIGEDDELVDGNITYHIVTTPSVSTDPAFNGLNPKDAVVVNLDNDIFPWIMFLPAILNHAE